MGLDIKEFVKEKQYMTPMGKDVDMDAVLSVLTTLSANVEEISESDELKKLVHSIPVGYSVQNPVTEFVHDAKYGKYDKLSDEEYQARLENVNAISLVLYKKYSDTFIDVDMRDTYAKMLEAVAQVQTCLRQMYDTAMFLKVMDAVEESDK